MDKEHYVINTSLSKNNLYEVLYWVCLHRGSIKQTQTMATLSWDKRQNARNNVDLLIELPEGKKEDFEKDSGFTLKEPFLANVN